jgi:hypothetical protein
MNPGEPTSEKRPRGKTGWIVALVVLVGLFGAGVLFLISRPVSRFSPAAMISVQEYFELKSARKVQAAWLDGMDLYVEVNPKYVRDGERFRYVAVVLPPAYRFDPGFGELKADIDPARFTVLRK